MFLMLDVVKHFDDRILASAAFTVTLHNQNVTLPPRRVVDLIDMVRPRIEQILSVHDIIKPGVDFDIGWQVDNFDVDLLQVGPGRGIRIVQVKRVGNIGVEYFGERLFILPEDVQLVVGPH